MISISMEAWLLRELSENLLGSWIPWLDHFAASFFSSSLLVAPSVSRRCLWQR